MSNRPGFNRPKDRTTVLSQRCWWVVVVVSIIWAGFGAGALLLVALAALLQIGWLQWSATCEDRDTVKRVNIVLGTAIVALNVHANREEAVMETRRQETEQARRQSNDYERAYAALKGDMFR